MSPLPRFPVGNILLQQPYQNLSIFIHTYFIVIVVLLLLLFLKHLRVKNIMTLYPKYFSQNFPRRGKCSYIITLSMIFSRQEYWTGQPFPSPGDLPDPGIKPRSPALQVESLPSEPPGKPLKINENIKRTIHLEDFF